MDRLIVHGRITRTWAKLQLKAVRLFNPDAKLSYDPNMPANSFMVVECNDDDA